MGSRTNYVKQYKNSENKCKKDLKSLKKQNKMLYRIAKKSFSHREIKRIRAKASMNTSISSSDDSDSNPLIVSDSS